MRERLEASVAKNVERILKTSGIDAEIDAEVEFKIRIANLHEESQP